MYRASVLSLLLLSQPEWAVDAHHPTDTTSTEITSTAATTSTDAAVEQLDSSVNQLQEMRQKIQEEKDPARKRELMHQHMMHMRAGMQIMSMKGMHGMMGMDASSMPMNINKPPVSIYFFHNHVRSDTPFDHYER